MPDPARPRSGAMREADISQERLDDIELAAFGATGAIIGRHYNVGLRRRDEFLKLRFDAQFTGPCYTPPGGMWTAAEWQWLASDAPRLDRLES